MTIKLSSPAFSNGQPIPRKYACDDSDLSPPLNWSNVPESAKSLALICDDPDAPAGTWVHWVLYGLPANANQLPERVPATETLSNGARQGVNDFGRLGYGGPCPPPGKLHRYFFRLYALDQDLNLPPRATQAQIVAAIQGHILAEGQLMGTYQRQR
jgi:Raf kinase inhibitor-like YbhB/YbcL family protein